MYSPLADVEIPARAARGPAVATRDMIGPMTEFFVRKGDRRPVR